MKTTQIACLRAMLAACLLSAGSVSATEDSGTIELQTGDFDLDWPALFGGLVEAESLNGEVIWRQSRDAINIVSAYLGVIERVRKEEHATI